MITKEQALEIAKTEAVKNGWEWREPLHVSNQGAYWRVISNFISKGRNVIVVIDKNTGEIKSANWVSADAMGRRE